jgi:hypothetical protein
LLGVASGDDVSTAVLLAWKGTMKTFNLYADEWDERRDREGWEIKAHGAAGEPIMFAQPGPQTDYWEGEG